MVAFVAGDKPMTFSGQSYVHWELTVSMEKRLNLELQLRTLQPHARLMHAVGRVDYSILEVTGGGNLLFSNNNSILLYVM